MLFRLLWTMIGALFCLTSNACLKMKLYFFVISRFFKQTKISFCNYLVVVFHSWKWLNAFHYLSISLAHSSPSSFFLFLLLSYSFFFLHFFLLFFSVLHTKLITYSMEYSRISGSSVFLVLQGDQLNVLVPC